MAEWARAGRALPALRLAVLLTAYAETAPLLILLALALLARLVGLGTLEPNILPDEADHLSLLYRILAGHGPSILQLSWDGNPAASLYPAIPFLLLFGPTYLALRLSTTLGSLLTLAVFFAYARRSLGLFASFCATALLAFSSWFLFFSRNGEVNVWVPLLTLAAAYAVEQACLSNRWRDWVTAGLFCGLGWYTYLGGVFILPQMLLYLAVAAILERTRWRVLLRGGLLMTLVTLAVLLPRAPSLIAERDAVALYVGGRSVLQHTPPAELPATLANQLAIAVRAFILLDPTLPGNVRYIAPGAPVLDSLTGTLYVIGLLLSLRRLRQTALWWCLFTPIILILQPLTLGIPDGARALAALPAMLLFAGLTIDWLVRRPWLGDLAMLALAVAVPIAAYWNWQHYVTWQRSPANAAARQPAVEIAEFPRWQQLQLARAAAGERGFTVNEWHQMRDRLGVPGPPTGRGRPAAPERFEARVVDDFTPDLVIDQPRGVALGPDGSAVILDGHGALLRLGPDGRLQAKLDAAGRPTIREPADLAVGPDGDLYALDAARETIHRYRPDGAYVESIGMDWGMYHPRGLAVDAEGRLYVADTGRNRVIVARDGQIENEIGGLEQPTDVAVDDQGWLYAIEPEASRLSVVDAQGQVRARWPIQRTNTIDGPHLALTAGGVLALTDPPGRRVVFLDLTGRELAAIGGAEDAGFQLPYAIAAAGDRVLVTDLAAETVRLLAVAAR